MIKSVTWVDGAGEVRRSANPSPEFNALSAGLGLTGIITEVTLQLTAPTSAKLVTRYLSNDTSLFEDVEKMLKVGALRRAGLALKGPMPGGNVTPAFNETARWARSWDAVAFEDPQGCPVSQPPRSARPAPLLGQGPWRCPPAASQQLHATLPLPTPRSTRRTSSCLGELPRGTLITLVTARSWDAPLFSARAVALALGPAWALTWPEALAAHSPRLWWRLLYRARSLPKTEGPSAQHRLAAGLAWGRTLWCPHPMPPPKIHPAQAA
jgi:hypothetical protein